MDETCSQASRDVGEDLGGTASSAEHWIGVEFHGPWRPKAVTDNDLPTPTRAFLASMQARDDTRPTLLKRRGGRGAAVFYVHAPTGRVHRFDLDDPATVPDLPWDSLFSGQSAAGLTDERPLWVCTHSNRDACCGLHGAPTVRALDAVAPGRVWQCTHLGGHRFAATLVAPAAGVHFGRVRPDEAAALVAALDAGMLYDLDRVRGSLVVPPAAQAAELAVRRATGERKIDAVRAVAWAADGAGSQVEVHHRGATWKVAVERARGEAVAPPSCGEAPAPVVGWRCRLVGPAPISLEGAPGGP